MLNRVKRFFQPTLFRPRSLLLPVFARFCRSLLFASSAFLHPQSLRGRALRVSAFNFPFSIRLPPHCVGSLPPSLGPDEQALHHLAVDCTTLHKASLKSAALSRRTPQTPGPDFGLAGLRLFVASVAFCSNPRVTGLSRPVTRHVTAATSRITNASNGCYDATAKIPPRSVVPSSRRPVVPWSRGPVVPRCRT